VYGYAPYTIFYLVYTFMLKILHIRGLQHKCRCGIMILQGILHKFTTYVNTSLSCRVSDNDIYAHIFVIFLVCIFLFHLI